jgi:YggT family protein
MRPKLPRRALPDSGGTVTPPVRAKLPPRGSMLELLNFINYVINLYSYVVFAAVIMSFLLAFNVINPRNAVVQTIWTTLTALTEPLLGPIRRALPDFGAIDLSPVVLLLGLYFIQSVVLTNLARAVS